MNRKSAGVLGIALGLGGSSLALSCLSEPGLSETGGGGAGASSIGSGGDAIGSGGDARSHAGGAGGMAESGEGGLNDGGGFAQGGAEPIAAGAAGEGGSTSGAGGDSGQGGSDVVGTVIDGEGAAVAAAKVEIAGQLVVTDAMGRFAVHHVPETYSAVIVFAPPPTGVQLAIQAVEIYDELTTRSPQFRLAHAPDPTHWGALSGEVSGGAGFPVPDGHKFGATASNGWIVEGKELIYPTTYAFPVLPWVSEPANKWVVGGLQWRAGVNGLPTGYDGWASHEVVLPSTAQYPVVTLDLVLAPVESRTVTGTITKPSDCTVAVQGSVGGIVLFDDVPTTPTFSYLMPKPLSGATTALTARCGWHNSVSVGLDASNVVDLTLEAPPSLAHPANQATGITYATPFSWDAGDHELRDLVFEGGGWTIHRYGKGTSSTLPDLTRFGISIPAGSPFSWRVVSFELDAGAVTTWDEMLGTSEYDYVTTGHSISKGSSESRTFTLTP